MQTSFFVQGENLHIVIINPEVFQLKPLKFHGEKIVAENTDRKIIQVTSMLDNVALMHALFYRSL